jgi:hypothetical protein
VNQEQQVREERKEGRGSEGKRGLQVLLEQTDLPETKDFKARKDRLALTVFLEYLAYMGM